MTASPWTCPDCGAPFANRDASHSCVVIDLDPHFEKARPGVRAAFDRLVEIASVDGPIPVVAQKTRIVFASPMRFLAIQVPRDRKGDPMKFEGTVEIRAPRDRVWAFLMDPNQVGSCGPGVESIEVVDETHFKAKAKVGIGFISARFVVDAEIAEIQPPDRAVIKAHGQAPGSALDATATMSLRDGTDGGTVMDWAADVLIGGSLASVGARMIEGTANKMIGQTFECIRTKLEA